MEKLVSTKASSSNYDWDWKKKIYFSKHLTDFRWSGEIALNTKHIAFGIVPMKRVCQGFIHIFSDTNGAAPLQEPGSSAYITR